MSNTQSNSNEDTTAQPVKKRYRNYVNAILEDYAHEPAEKKLMYAIFGNKFNASMFEKQSQEEQTLVNP